MNVNRKSLSSILKTVAPAKERGTDSPIFGSFLIRSGSHVDGSGFLTVAAVGYDIYIRAVLACEVEKGDKDINIAVPMKSLSSVVSSLSGDNVRLYEKSLALKIDAGREKAEVKGNNGDEFPDRLDGVSDLLGSFLFDGGELYQAVSKVAICASNELDRPALTGVNVSIKDKTAELSTADGYRLSVWKLALIESSGMDIDFLVPARSFTTAARTVKGGTVKIDVYKGRIVMTNIDGDLIVVVQLLDVPFPDLKGIIPNKSKIEFAVEKNPLLLSLKRARIVNDAGDYPFVNFEVRKEDFIVRAGSEEVATHEEFVPSLALSGIDGKSFAFKMSSVLFAEIVESAGDARVQIKATSPTSPVVVLGDGGFWVIMPMLEN